MSTRWIRPGDAPRLNRRVPGAQRGAVHVQRLIDIGAAILVARHDPHVLDGASLEDASGVDLSLQSARGDVDSAIVKDVEVPASTQPAVDVGRFGNLG